MQGKNIADLKIVIIGIYYGKFPAWMQYWLRSCADNPSIDFLLVTDIKMENLPDNVKIIDLTLSQVKLKFEKKLGMPVALEKPYKLCDFKPLYGLLLDNYIGEYDYWGHCDFDLIWGDIGSFVRKYKIEKYDKFLPLGHLSLYRNTEKCNHYFELLGSKCGDYKTVLQNEENFAFDETGGIYSIYEYNHLPMFINRIFAEIKTYHKRFRLKSIDKNYKHQVFYYEDGKIFRAYENNAKVGVDEYIYIHFRKKLSVNENINWKEIDNFYITPTGFFRKNQGVPSVKEMEKYNKNPGGVAEMIETVIFCVKNVFKIKSKVENEIISRRKTK